MSSNISLMAHICENKTIVIISIIVVIHQDTPATYMVLNVT